jgi:hypothetical protein
MVLAGAAAVMAALVILLIYFSSISYIPAPAKVPSATIRRSEVRTLHFTAQGVRQADSINAGSVPAIKQFRLDYRFAKSAGVVSIHGGLRNMDVFSRGA